MRRRPKTLPGHQAARQGQRRGKAYVRNLEALRRSFRQDGWVPVVGFERLKLHFTAFEKADLAIKTATSNLNKKAFKDMVTIWENFAQSVTRGWPGLAIR
jgi:hypothetical protein